MKKRRRVGLVTLGCDKNTVDNEYLAGLLEDAGCEIVPHADAEDTFDLDAVVITTCGFIGDAKEESLDALLAWSERKKERGDPARVFVAGCLSQRYAGDLLEELPELDGIAGVGQFEHLAAMVLAAGSAPRKQVHDTPRVEVYRHLRRRRLDDAPHAFLKISDGCNHGCTFCSIPLMKGRLRSVPREVLLAEAEELVAKGVRELILVAQDLAAYGKDTSERYRLPDLLNDLTALEGDFRVRCLYVYPGGVTDALIDTLAHNPKVTPYLDIPLQHTDPDVLKTMRRPFSNVSTLPLVEKLRERVPDIALRTTMIVGFPGETPKAHRAMLEALTELRFNWLGAFEYSREEDTPAGRMAKQVGAATRRKRWNAVMELQAEITAEINEARVGTKTRVLIEGAGPRGTYFGRSAWEAPEVDGTVFVHSATPLRVGDFVNAEITRADVYDVHARPC